MREILFRGKALSKSTFLKSEDGWVYGVPVPITIDAYHTDRVEIVKCHGYDELDCYNLLSEDDEVDPKTIGQYTGLKDKNGRKIFEGDIVKCSEPKVPADHVPILIYYENGAFMYRFARKPWAFNVAPINDVCYGLDVEECEIIGNIHDNPELLEVN